MVWHVRSYGFLLAISLTACGGADATKDADERSPEDDGSGNGAGGDGDGDFSDGGTSLPPEVEENVSFETPRAGKTCVYVPNPVTNRVAIVNAETFTIETVRTGKTPTFAATVPGKDMAIVLNVGSSDAALLRTEEGHTTATRLEVGHDANAIAVAPEGGHAVLYFDARVSDTLASTFQDVTVVKLEAGHESSRGVSVGFHPRAVQFSQDGVRAFVITDDGVSIIDLAEAVEGPTVARLVSVGDKLSEAVSSDVQVTRDGKFALARREGSSVLRLVDLETGKIHTLDLRSLQASAEDADGGAGDAGEGAGLLPAGALELTDVDLAPDSSFAVAVLRSSGTVLRIPIPSGFADEASITARVIEEQRVGSVSLSRTGKLAVLYTTAEAAEGLVLLDLATDAAPRGVRLRKAVRAVALSDDGSRALVLHAATPGDPDEAGLDEDARIDRAEGYSLVDTDTGFAKLKLTDAKVSEQDILVTPDATRMFALLRDDSEGVSAYETADLRSFEVKTHTLSHAPSSIGLVPGVDRVFIGQESEGGMISFIDAETGDVVRPVAGFELVSGIRQ